MEQKNIKREIFIKTIKTQEKNTGFASKTKKTAGTQDMLIDVVDGRVRMDLEKTDNGLPDKFTQLLDDTNLVIKEIADSLGNSVAEVENLEEMDVEFGIGNTEKLNLGVFELGGNQSLKVKIKLKKKQE